MRRVHLDKSHFWSNLLDERYRGTRHDVVCRRSEAEDRQLHRSQFASDIHIKDGSKSFR